MREWIISIHALREESDLLQLSGEIRHADISIHALREESDFQVFFALFAALLFQSTLSVRRATRIHSSDTKILLISIHALREESDRWLSSSSKRSTNFNPRSP